MFDSSINKDGSQCTLFITAIEEDMMIFGIPAYQGYYTTHDNERDRMGIVPHSTSSKSKLDTSNPDRVGVIKKGRYGEPPLWSLILTLVLVTGGMGALFWFVIISWVEDEFKNKWTRAALYTAYWFLVVGFLVLIRFFFTL